MIRNRDDVLAQFSVSRETASKLDLMQRELIRWQTVKNLVAPSTLNDIWFRHIADSLQLGELIDELRSPSQGEWSTVSASLHSHLEGDFPIVDFGSGAGFPGLVLAILGIDCGWHVHLVESNARKCAFLKHVSRETGAKATIHQVRIEDIAASFAGKAKIVTARALANLSQLLDYSDELLTTGAIGLFPKGRSALEELTEAQKNRTFSYRLIPSKTDPDARIVVVRMP